MAAELRAAAEASRCSVVERVAAQHVETVARLTSELARARAAAQSGQPALDSAASAASDAGPLLAELGAHWSSRVGELSARLAAAELRAPLVTIATQTTPAAEEARADSAPGADALGDEERATLREALQRHADALQEVCGERDELLLLAEALRTQLAEREGSAQASVPDALVPRNSLVLPLSVSVFARTSLPHAPLPRASDGAALVGSPVRAPGGVARLPSSPAVPSALVVAASAAAAATRSPARMLHSPPSRRSPRSTLSLSPPAAAAASQRAATPAAGADSQAAVERAPAPDADEPIEAMRASTPSPRRAAEPVTPRAEPVDEELPRSADDVAAPAPSPTRQWRKPARDGAGGDDEDELRRNPLFVRAARARSTWREPAPAQQ